ncbi:MAG: hypothetical protein MUE73_22030 [Planctomycetes bacterium]|jgi:hypothetical protein|nr:hypothetical protein [Planctomycetota bacterium]
MSALHGVLWIGVLVLLMHLLRDLWAPLLRRRGVKAAIAPGVLVFLFFRILACHAAGARVAEVRPFDDHDEILKHEKPGLGVVGEFLIGVLPLLCLLLAFALLASAVPLPRWTSLSLPPFSELWNSPSGFFRGAWDFLAGFLGNARGAAALFSFWALAYAAVNVLLAGAPSVRELRYVAVAAAAAIGGALLFDWLQVRIGSRAVLSFFQRFADSVEFLLGSGVAWVLVSVVAVGSWRLFLEKKEGGEGRA